MDKIYFYLYIIFLILSLTSYTVLKCIYKINSLDSLIYSDSNDTSLLSKMQYFLSHFVFYAIFGILFGLDILPEMIIKTIVIEFILILIKNCNLFDLKDVSSGILSIFVGILSYMFGALILKIFLEKK